MLAPAVGASSSLTAASATHAVAVSGPSCSGRSCRGRDPYFYNCGRYTKTSAGAFSGNTELAVLFNWYGHCNANWSEGYLTQAGLNANDTIMIDTYTTDSFGQESMCAPYPFGFGNAGFTIEYCINGSIANPSCRFAGPSDYPANKDFSGTMWTDMVDGTDVAYSEVCVFHGSTLVAYGSTRQ